MGIYNIDKIESWYNDFSSIKNKYINGYYRDYQNSYLKRCGDSYVVSMRNNLNKRYEKIKEMYIKIDRYWSDYINDVKNTDNRLAGRGGGINVASIAYKINSLPILQEYNDGSVSLVMNINNTYSKYSYEIENLFSQTGAVCNRVMATATLLVTSVKEGLVKLLEMAGDLIIIVGAVQCAIYTGAVDLYNNATGNKSNYTEQLWDETRAIVSVDNTKMIFDDFYDKTFVGSWIKSNAYGFDSIREVGCEVGEVIGVAALSIVTGGGGAVMYGAVKATEHTEENWQDPETSTFAGLAKGSIRGVMDGVMYALGAKGDVVMKKAATKAVEAGGKTILKKAGILAGKMAFEVGCSFTQDFSNIFIDSAFSNNKIVDSNGNTIEFSNFKEKLNYYYNEAGGSKQLLMSAGTAMILSGLSDAIDLNKIGKNVSGLDDVTNETKFFANDTNSGNYVVNNSTLKNSDVNSLYNFFYQSGNSYNGTYGVDQGCIEKLCDYYLNGKKYSYREARDIVNYAKKNGYVRPRFKERINSSEYGMLKDKLISKGLTKKQASVILSSVNDVGACSYAAKANAIFYKFSNNPELFQEKFGFPMYKLNDNGERVLNSSELLLDMYMFANDTSNGGKLFTKNANNSYTFYTSDKVDVFGRKMLDTSNQTYMSSSLGSNDLVLNNYMNSKGLNWHSHNFISNCGGIISDEVFSEHLGFITEAINNGYAVQLGIGSNCGDINMHSTHPEAYPSLSTHDWVTKELNINGEIVKKNAGHAVFVTSMDDEGFIVSSWGKEYKILFEDLKNGGFFNMTIDNVY